VIALNSHTSSQSSPSKPSQPCKTRNTQRFVPKLPTPPPVTGKSLRPVLHPDFATTTDVSAVGNFTAPSLRHVQTPMRNMPSQPSQSSPSPNSADDDWAIVKACSSEPPAGAQSEAVIVSAPRDPRNRDPRRARPVAPSSSVPSEGQPSTIACSDSTCRLCILKNQLRRRL